MSAGTATAARPATGWSLVAATYVFAVVMIGTTIPTPLYPTYESRFGFGSTTTTVLFAVYAGGVILALVLGGRLSDAVGRRPMLFAGIVFSLASAVVFAIGTAEWMLFVARVLSGLSAGIFTATGTVAVLENAPEQRRGLASALATAANIGGLGLGMLLAGAVATVTPWPLRAPYVAHAVLLVIAGVALLAVRDSVTPDRSRIRLQLPGIPPESRGVFAASAVGAVVGFAVCGLYSSVAPNFMGKVLGVESPFVVGVVVFALFGASAAAQIALRGLADRTLIVIGALALAAGMGVLVWSLLATSLALLVGSSILAGIGQGLLFMTGLRAITGATDASRRTEATTSYFVLAYLSISIPAIGAGLLAAGIGLVAAGVVFALVVAVVSLIGLTAARRFAA
ncbi:MFS transporter [Curtobacterium sp. PhB136]|uniref:MFS transporter n=1 Tax=Curtobacterium sp. PhB136 TaxID=2485181 RepID=UPI00105164E0|nr:MFS transporter [Curtobacterium sp. PhB136]TCK64530.1 putative MFS family arabinose efflux permease [Curtobacterium sp. PhB136]